MNFDSPKKLDDALQNILKSESELAVDRLESIVKNLPPIFSDLIKQAFKFKRIPKEYMLSSILFSVCTSAGMTFYLKALGYKNYGNCYFTIIGSRGDSKSEAIKIATQPLKDLDDADYDMYLEELGNRSDSELDPKRKQILIQNASIEAAHKVHSENPNSIGIAIDEIYALVERMANPNSRDGIAWRNFFLEGYTNGHVDISRKTTESFRIKETCPTLLGGIQSQFVPKLFSNGNLESGFIDRQFFTPKLTSNKELVWGNITPKTIDYYNNAIHNVLAYKRQSERSDETKKQFEIELSKEAHHKIFEYTQELICRQSCSESVIKEYMSKMQISIHKLCVIVFLIRHAERSTFASTLNIDIVNLAIDINEFYFMNFQSIVKGNYKADSKASNLDDIIKVAKENNASQKAVVEVTGLHKSTISRKWNNF